MFVKMLTAVAGPDRNHSYGHVVEMDDAEAARYCEANLAVPATDSEIENAKAKLAAKEVRTGAGPEQVPGSADPSQAGATPDAAPILEKMTKAEIVAHAAEVHTLELDPSKKKADLIAAIAKHVEGAAPAQDASSTPETGNEKPETPNS